MLNQVTCGNCLDLMRELPDNYVDSVITDPPYEIGFMGKSWDNTGIAFNTDVWAECLRVAKPGAFLLAFGGTRTWHRIAVAIEDAGWALRDSIVFWTYGSGFPKSKSLREVGAEWAGYGTALKPSHEPIMVFMKPCDGTFAQNAEKFGIAGLDIDAGRIDSNGETIGRPKMRERVRGYVGIKSEDSIPALPASPFGRWPANTILSCFCEDEDNHDADCPVRIMDKQSGVSKSGTAVRRNSGGNTFGGDNKKPAMEDMSYSDTGGASRFFYCAKPSKSEKSQGLEVPCSHPTVKPISLLRYLCKLTRPPHGGIVLDPFTGSGTTGIAAILEDRDFIGFELSQEYTDIANARIEHHAKQEDLCLSI